MVLAGEITNAPAVAGLLAARRPAADGRATAALARLTPVAERAVSDGLSSASRDSVRPSSGWRDRVDCRRRSATGYGPVGPPGA